MGKKNFLIGRAEKLGYQTPPPKINPSTSQLYTWEEILQRVQPQLEKVAELQEQMDSDICPGDFSVTKITLHPTYIAKSFYPNRLLRSMDVVSIGSRATLVTPDKWLRKGQPEETPTTSLFVAGRKAAVSAFANTVENIPEGSGVGTDLSHIWEFDLVAPSEKIRQNEAPFEGFFEVGLYLLPDENSEFIVDAFVKYAESLDFFCNRELEVSVSNLRFIPLEGDRSQIELLARFSFVRVIRPIAAIRSFRPITRGSTVPNGVTLTDADAYSQSISVAILDGGLSKQSHLSRWVNTYIESDDKSTDDPDGITHGHSVTSAFLFGPLAPGEESNRPYSNVDHIRVLDSNSAHESPYELYRTLGHVEDVLISGQYDFINLSLGPDLPIDDDDIHPWTSLIDSHLSNGDRLLTIAAGNNGREDELTGLSRVQVPSDCVNALAIGAADSRGAEWARADYSAIGPGRSPGLVKPDFLTFGGCHSEYFHVLSDGSGPPQAVPVTGTSFAAPYALREAVGIRAILGNQVSMLAIKALLIHGCNQDGHHRNDVGWGRLSSLAPMLVESPPCTAKVLYQGKLEPGKYLRLPLPIPDTGLKGRIKISATCCISSPLDPKDTSMYTKAGVDISWYPKKGGKPESFFKKQQIATEAELRRDAMKWESVSDASVKKLGSSLDEPEFQVHYIAREGGASVSGSRADEIDYAFVATIQAPRHEELFAEILNAYAEILTEIEPQVSIQVST